MKEDIYSARGFTLLEIVIAVALSTSIVIGVAAFTLYYLRSYSFSYEEEQSISTASYTMSTMIREIREARSGEDGAWPLVETNDTSLIFYSDVTNDGRSDRVRYFMNGTDLQKGVIEPTAVPISYPSQNEIIKTIATFIDLDGNALFRYYNGSWPADQVNNPLSLENRILNTRYVTLFIRVNIQPNYAAAPYELRSGVQIRSLKDNL